MFLIRRTAALLVFSASMLASAAHAAALTIASDPNDGANKKDRISALLTTRAEEDVVLIAHINVHTNGSERGGDSTAEILVGGSRCGAAGSTAWDSGDTSYDVSCFYHLKPGSVSVFAHEIDNHHATASSVSLSVRSATDNGSGEIR